MKRELVFYPFGKIPSQNLNSIEIKNGYIRPYKDQLQLNIGKYGSWKRTAEDMNVPESLKQIAGLKWYLVHDLKDKMFGINIILKIDTIGSDHR